MDGAILDSCLGSSQNEVAKSFIGGQMLLNLSFLVLTKLKKSLELWLCETSILVLVKEIEGRKGMRHHETRS